MGQPNFARARVLIVGAKGYAARMLRTVLNAGGIVRIDVAEDPRRALELLCTERFDAVFIEEHVVIGATPFALAARRSKALLNPLIPIFAVYAGARQRDVERSRDLGVNGVIVRPVSPKTVMDKLALAFSVPGTFIAAPNFFGPDRRFKAHRGPPPGGSDRRSRLAKKAKLQMLDV